MKTSTNPLRGKPALPFSLSLAVVFLAACDKPKRLEAEARTINSQREAIEAESQGYVDKIQRFSAPGVATAGQVNTSAADVLAKAGKKQAEAAAELAKWQAIESELKTVQTRVDAWKAKHLK